jgi:hypothetical protein
MEKNEEDKHTPIFKYSTENETEDILLQGQVIIKDNYLVELTNNKTKSIYNSRLFHVNENINQPKLYEQLIGKQVLYVINLEPRTIRGVESHGMLMAVGDEVPVFLIPEKKIPSGSRVR